MPQADVSVVIPVLDDGVRLGRCLDALAAQDTTARVEVVVADNGSRDASAEVAQSHPVTTTVVHQPRPGSYAARNAALAVTTAPVLAFTDADCLPAPDWIRRGLAAVDGTDRVAGDVRMTHRDTVSPWEAWDAAHYLDQGDHVRDGFAATANLFARREVFDAVGVFAAELRSSGDLEWGVRATAAGFSLVHAPDAVVCHPARRGLGELWALHRRLAAGWHVLARRGDRPPAWRDPYMRLSFREAQRTVTDLGLEVPAPRLAAAHAVVLAARWTGRVTGR